MYVCIVILKDFIGVTQEVLNVTPLVAFIKKKPAFAEDLPITKGLFEKHVIFRMLHSISTGVPVQTR